MRASITPITLLLSLVLTAPLFAQLPADSVRSTALVWAEFEEGKSQSSAVIIDAKHGLALVACHPIRKSHTIRVLPPIDTNNALDHNPETYFALAKAGKSRRARVLLTDTRRDVVVVQIEDATGLLAMPFASVAPAARDAQHLIGNPSLRARMFDIVDGTFVKCERRDWSFEDGQRVDAEFNIVQTQDGIGVGFSGGALVNAQGELTGMIVAADGGRSQDALCLTLAEINIVRASAYRELARESLQARRLGEAAEFGEASLRVKRDDALTWAILGCVWQQQQDVERARTAYNESLKLNPFMVPALLGRVQPGVQKK